MTLDKAIKLLLVKEPFYGLFIMSLNRRYDDSVPTACVERNGINIDLLVNEKFWNTLTDDEQLGVIKHECGHILYKHFLMGKDFPDHERFNISADCEINSDIPALQKDPYCYPSRYKLPDHLGSMEYYRKLPQDLGEGEGPDHSNWKSFDDMTDTEKELVNNQVDYIAKNVAEQVQRMAGNIPGQFQGYIEGLFKKKPQVFNWKAYFRNTLGNKITDILYLTRMRPSRRFDQGRGVRFKRKSSVLVGVDTSGSVADKELLDFMAEIDHLYRAGVDVTIAQIDTKINHIEQYNGKFDKKVYGRGGTNFNDLYDHYREHRKDFSTLVIFTDGYVNINNAPDNTIWVITPDGAHQEYPGITVYMPESK